MPYVTSTDSRIGRICLSAHSKGHRELDQETMPRLDNA